MAALCLIATLTPAFAQEAMVTPVVLPGAPMEMSSLEPPAELLPVPSTLFARTLAEALAGDETLVGFYARRDWAPVWTGAEDAPRRAAFFGVLAEAGPQGLPERRYDAEGLVRQFHDVLGERDRGLLEAAMTRAFLSYARDVNSGVLTPARIDPAIVRQVRRPQVLGLMDGIAGEAPARFLASLPPHSAEYAALLREKAHLEAMLSRPSGPVITAEVLKPGQVGPDVVALARRLTVLGYPAGDGQSYDGSLRAAVKHFQQDRGLNADGVAGRATLQELNRNSAGKLAAVLAALERERWSNFDRGRRHIWVNIADFQVKIVENGRVTFSTRSVVGKAEQDHETPEFSDMMQFMVVNPRWNVPRSISTKEYLPKLQKNPNAVAHLDVVDRAGNVIPRDAVDFTQFTPQSFPYRIRQAPGDDNALGLVKFMFPNRYNIYLHDTPSKSLFGKDVRAFSHGCIRLADPFDFAYALLSAQESDPVARFQRVLATGKETTIRLKEPVPIHLDYRTAFSDDQGHIVYRADVYGRDGKIAAALEKAGVALPGIQG
ncbi:peptidoglycan-binding protein [Haematobacter missouriensis]|nr:peptidoglycan-binding protein [Haematobacter missouriensis]